MNLVSRVGIEPTTPCLRGRCSNRLSYRPKFLTTSIIAQIPELLRGIFRKIHKTDTRKFIFAEHPAKSVI